MLKTKGKHYKMLLNNKKEYFVLCQKALKKLLLPGIYSHALLSSSSTMVV